MTPSLTLVVPIVLHVCLARPSLEPGGWHSYEGRGHSYQHEPPQPDSEPSSRDLDIGFSVGGSDQAASDRRPNEFNIGVYPDRPTPYQGRGHEGFVRDSQPAQWRRWGGHDLHWGGDGAPLGTMLDTDGDPEVLTQPLGYKVGEFKLRSDQGYQLSMHVPPSSVGDRPGVLKIDMKATLYRPIYY